jgi:hypothetical protein
MSVVLWPRQEVLQLVIPQLSTIGKGLHLSTVGELSRKLLELRNSQGKINLPSWLNAARVILKWNDQSIYLFWEVLQLAVHYLNPDLIDKYEEDKIEIDVECIIIFLVLHVTDNAPVAKAIPTTSFDSVWPINPEGDIYPSSPNASPSSPVRDRSTHRSSPIASPRSPRNQTSPHQNVSPKRMSPSSPRTPRISTQHLLSVRQKIPIILRALSWAYSTNANEDITAFLAEDHREPENASSINMFVVDRKIADYLGLVICGGYSRDQCVSPFSSLHPIWANVEADNVPTRSMLDVMDAISLAGGQLTSVDYLSWLNLHLSMNDVLYPATLTTANTGLTGTGAVIDSMDPTMKDSKHQYPHRASNSIFSLSRFNPTVINYCSTTIIHNVTSGPSRAASFRQRSMHNMRLQDSDRMDMQTVGSEPSLRINRFASLSHDYPETDVDSIVQELGIPENVMDQDGISSGASPLNSPWKMKTDDNSDDDTESTGFSRRGLGANPAGMSFKSGSQFYLAGLRPELTLPQLYVSYSRGARLYMISPYYSASITGCVDSQIVVGSVFGSVIVNGCERVKITVACRKLIVINCLECEFNIASLGCSIIMGDSRNLTFGPHNAPYRTLRNHLRIAGLTDLIHQPHGSVEGEEVMVLSTANAWALVCDVNACVDATSKSYNATSECQTNRMLRFPLPSSSTAMIQTPDQFKFVTIPLKPEFVNNFDNLAIGIPPTYLEHIRQVQEKIEATKTRLVTALSEHSPDAMQADTTSADDEEEKHRELTAKILTSSAISKRFMDWLVATDNIQEVLDLIRIDTEKSGH